jgi:superfamily II DNA or RNA helicase
MQLNDDFEDYNNGKLPMRIRMVYGGSKDNDPGADVIAGTFQSLCKKPIEYFKGVDVVCADEAHQSGTTSVKNVLGKCKDSRIRFGLSGTLQMDNSADYMTIVSVLGPLVNTISAKFLFKEGYATPINVKIIKLSYEDSDIGEKLYSIRKSRQMEGSQLLTLEKNVVVQHKGRFNFVVNLISKTSKNSLVLFSNIKDGYGKRIYEALRDRSDKVCYYVDGGVGKDHREFFKKEMEEGGESYTIIKMTFGNVIYEFREDEEIILSDSSKKLAKNITVDDDIDMNYSFKWNIYKK